ncbi:MAG TPA: DUF427 domain-containing protein [Candidatus Thermoplasmatota archaeon]|nr:DUF427 domain-containing protein [Candidatus Thermoplasmatota archaeon]
MMRATWAGEAVAWSDSAVEVEGIQYFPKDAVRMELLRSTAILRPAPGVGTVLVCDVVAGGWTTPKSAWVVQRPAAGMEPLQGRVGFVGGVSVEEVPDTLLCRIPREQAQARYQDAFAGEAAGETGEAAGL